MIGKNRVVITGLGVLAANGIGKDAFWSSLLAGESGIGPVTLCDVENIASQIAGEVKNFCPSDYLEGKIKPKRITRQTQLAIAAAKLAIQDSGIRTEDLQKKAPLTIMMGAALGGFDFIEGQIRRIISKGNHTMLPTVIGCVHSAPASTLAALLEVHSETYSTGNTCVAGLDAVAASYHKIRDGKTEVAIAGGSDAPIETSLMAGFSAGQMLCTLNDDPQTASCPFDAKHEFGVLAEGSAIVILESLDHALDRGAIPYAEVIGYSTLCDPFMSAGSGLQSTMAGALNNAGIPATAIDYINAHGPSDINIDRTETKAIRDVLKNHAYNIPVSSIKGVTGNPLAGGGVMQTIATALGMQSNIIPPTTNLHTPDLECDLDYVPNTPRKGAVEHALINSCGVGKSNSSLILKRINCAV